MVTGALFRDRARARPPPPSAAPRPPPRAPPPAKMMSMEPFAIRATDNTVEVWSGYRIQFGDQERHEWQKALKAELKRLFQGWASLAVPVSVPLVGYYDSTNPAISDTENSLFTNLRESMPRGFKSLRFEHGTTTPPAPPVPINLIDGHLHYYRYQVGGEWIRWEPNQTLATWDRIPRRLAADGSARPAWYPLRDANANGLICLTKHTLNPDAHFGLRLTVHATKTGPSNAISYSEELIDGTIAAFHNDRYSPELLSALAPKSPSVPVDELRRALDHPVGPLITTPAIHAARGRIQISPADERCRLGELTIRQDSTSPWPELSGELFTIRSTGGLGLAGT